MSIFVTTQDLFDKASAQYHDKIVANHWKGVDKELVPLIRLLNQLSPNVVTAFCCSGHPETEKPKRFYISFLVVGNGAEYLMEWFDRTNNKIIANSKDPDIGPLKCQFTFEVGKRTTVLIDKTNELTNGIAVRLPIKTSAALTKIIRFMEDATVEMITSKT